MDTETEEFLEHYGVLGMKWGVRNKPGGVKVGRKGKSSTGTLKDKTGVNNRTRYKKSSDAPTRLTDSELKARISRMETEKKYNELNARTVSQGEKLVTEVITNAGRKVATITLAGAGLHLVKKYVEKKWGVDVVNMIPNLKKM